MNEPHPGRPAGNGSQPADARARTVFFGSGSFGLPVLDALTGAPEVELVAVVGVPDRPAGRHARLTPVPVVARARELGLPVLQPARLRAAETVAELATLEPVLGVLADYGRIVPAAILALPRHGILNLHPSLLPRHRGASPIPATILEGDAEAGVTLMRMDERLDAGPIVARVAWSLAGDEEAPELEARAASEAARLLCANLGPWLSGALPARPQDEALATMTRPLARKDGRLDPSRSGDRLARQVRAFQPWPGSYLDTSEGRLLVWKAAAERSDAEIPAGARGALVEERGGLALVVADGLLHLQEVQLAGKRRMSGAELLRGHPGFVGGTRRPAT